MNLYLVIIITTVFLTVLGTAASTSEYQSGYLDGLKSGWLMGELKGQATMNATALLEYNRLVPEYNAQMEEVFGPGVVPALTPLDPEALSGYSPLQELIDAPQLIAPGNPILNDTRQGGVHEVDSFKNPTAVRLAGKVLEQLYSVGTTTVITLAAL